MAGLTASMEALIQALRKLPGVGPRTAERYVFYLLSHPSNIAAELSEAILRVKQAIGFCGTCFNLADGDTCTFCRDPGRDPSIVCVVEDHRSIRAMEKSGGYKGLYHVLLGSISPLDGIGPKDLRVPELKARVKAGGIREVILATDSDLEGETTALYLAKELKALEQEPPLKVSRLAFGIPMGSSVEYADQVTLGRALEGRRSL
ncbi:MAG: recombination mediator RecR [Candidatus Omnitrophota bacterium]|nr:recombination mediator RecR [Candidatus Omnitrophota bacterium]